MWAAGQKPYMSQCNEWGICVFEFIVAQKQLVQDTMYYILQPQLVAENVVVYQFFSEKINFLESYCVKTFDNLHV